MHRQPTAIKRRWVLAGLLVVAALAPAVVAAQTAIAVRSQPLNDLLVDVAQRAPAERLALQSATLSAEVAGKIAAIHAEVGTQVAAGDLLVEIESRDYDLALQQAQANLAALSAQREQARVRLQRAQKLGEGQYLSADELLARETDLAVIAAQISAAEVSVATARRALEKTRIAAPYPAVVESRSAQQGAFVSVGAPLLAVTGTSASEVDAEIPADLAGGLEQANAMHFSANGGSWPVQLLRLSPVVNPDRRTRRARFALIEGGPPIGTSGTVHWQARQGLLPAHLLVRRDGELGVFIATDGSAEFVVIPGAQEGRPAAVPAGAPWDANPEVITGGRERLQPGDRITTGG